MSSNGHMSELKELSGIGTGMADGNMIQSREEPGPRVYNDDKAKRIEGRTAREESAPKAYIEDKAKHIEGRTAREEPGHKAYIEDKAKHIEGPTARVKDKQTCVKVKPASNGTVLSTSLSEASTLHGPKVDFGNTTLTETLIESLTKHPDSMIQDISGEMHKYSTLKRDAVQMANFLLLKCRLSKGDHIGLLFENSYRGLTTIVACLLTGCVYVPLNPDDPKVRTEKIIRSSAIKLICFSKDTFSLASHLLWSSKGVECMLCIDSDSLNFTETPDCPLMNSDLWDFVAEETLCDVTDGWKNSFTGEPLSTEVLKDYVNNTIYKLQNHLDIQSSVLEIGSGSGLTTKALCSRVNRYVATDLSGAMTKRLQSSNLQNVQAHCIPAHEIGNVFKGYMFDLIILNSVVHCFPGYSYLRRVLEMCAAILTPNGKIFVGDIMDLNRRGDFEHALKAFKAANPRCRTKTDLSAELFVPEEFFETFGYALPTVNCTPKVSDIDCEVTRYRYDVLMTKETKLGTSKKATIKNMFSLNDLNVCSQTLRAPSTNINPDDDAYILYTSGTTGTPKGVRISQMALLNYCTWAASAYCLTTKSKMPLFSPLTFDFTVTSYIPPLLQGSSIRVFKPFAESFIDIANSRSLTAAKFSPLQLEAILASSVEPLSIDTYVLGGEEVTYALLERLKDNKRDMPFKVWNEYGPTEATVGCIAACIDYTEIEGMSGQCVPIGKPINNVTVAVIDGSEPVTVGKKGYLVIGGSCLSSGFVQAKEETIDIFKSACWLNDGYLMYRTTDIVSCSADQEHMYYFGRDGSDVTKINGIRVDISEAQSALRNISFVDEAWVSSFEMDGSTLLGAAVKLLQNAKYSDEDLRKAIAEEIRESIPVNCIPKVIVQLSSVPVNKNGKKDIVLLQSIFRNAMAKSSDSERCVPIETNEREFQLIWQETLQLKRLPCLDEDFFFDLFGNSIRAVYLVMKLKNVGFDLSVKDVFKNPTIRLLCNAIAKRVR